MQFIGIDLHTNKFNCNYRDENTPVDAKKGKMTRTFEFTSNDLSSFYRTLASDTYVLAEATITTFLYTADKAISKRGACGKHMRVETDKPCQNQYRQN